MPHPKHACIARLANAALVTGIAAACSTARPPEAPSRVDEEAPSAPARHAAEEPVEAPSEPASGPAPADLAEPSSPPDARGKAEIQQVIADNRAKVRACYDAALKENPGINGDLVLSFVIDPDGNVKAAETNWAESDLHVPELDTCAVEAVKTFKFPASSRGLESKVNYPFNFNPPAPEKPASKR